MWRKILKHRDKAKDMHMLRVGDGNNVSFWFDSQCTIGRLYGIFGSRGCIDMGVPKTEIVSAAMATQKAKMI